MTVHQATARRRAGGRVVVAVLSLASAGALAQTPPPVVRPDAGAILEQQRQPLRLPPPPDDDVRPKLPEPKPALPVSPTLKITPKQFTFTGNTLFKDEELTRVVAEYIGKELDFEGLTDAATKVRAYHRERGYFLAQAYLPEQTIRDGVIQIAIIEGRVGIVELQRRPATRLSEKLLAGILDAHLKTGDIITEVGLERPLLLINDLPTAGVTSEIRPSNTIGAADLRVNVDQGVGMVNGFAELDNHGARFTGEFRLGGAININNPTTLGDQFTFRGFVTDEEMWFGRVAYLIPAGYYGTRVGLSYTKFDYQLTKDFSALLAHGEGVVKSVFAFHPIYRTRNTNLIGQVAYEDKRLFDRVDSLGTVEDRYIDSLKFGVVGDFRDSVLSGGLNSFSLQYTAGDLALQPAGLLAADQAPATGRKTAGAFQKWNVDFRRLNRITDNASLLIAITGQSASNNLASAEKMSLGGVNGVRAYPVGEGAGDNGWVTQIEGRYIVPGVKYFEGDVMVSAFYDWGQVNINDKPLPTDTHNKRSISGYGVGGSLGREGTFIMRVMAAWKWDHETPQADQAKRVPRVWAQAIKWF